MITRENLKGIWAGVPTSFTEDGTFDAETFRDDVIRCCSLGIQGVYTTGSTGEFYALEFGEFKKMVDVFAEATKGRGIMTQVGCTWINTENVIERAKYAQSKGIMGVQVAFPFWHTLNDTEVLQFFRDISEACPDLPIIHYNSGLSGRRLQGRHYKRLVDEIPSLVGTKFTSTDFAEWMELMVEVPELSHFAGEAFLVPAMMTGGKGTYSNLIFTFPSLILRLYDHCLKHEWDEAVAIQKRIWMFYRACSFIEEGHEAYAVGDKAWAEAAGFLETKRSTRRPYLPLDEEEFAKLKEVLKQFPDFANKKESS